MQYCPDCGAEVESGDRFCLVCGTALDQPGQPVESEQERTPADTPSGTGHQPADTPSGTGHQPADTPSGGGHQPADTPSGGGHQPADTPSGTGNRPPEPGRVKSGPDGPRGHGRTPPQHHSPRSAPHPNASGSRFSKGTLTAVSILSALVAILFLPPVLGGISIYSGYKIYDVYDESLGRILIVVGVLATIAGMALGVLLLTA